jgi:DNA adenine methylase
MGGIFLRRKMRPRAEMINDFGRDVSNLFRILQRHYPQFLEVLRFQLTTLIDSSTHTLDRNGYTTTAELVDARS